MISSKKVRTITIVILFSVLAWFGRDILQIAAYLDIVKPAQCRPTISRKLVLIFRRWATSAQKQHAFEMLNFPVSDPNQTVYTLDSYDSAAVSSIRALPYVSYADNPVDLCSS
jgi:hypothetical protein